MTDARPGVHHLERPSEVTTGNLGTAHRQRHLFQSSNEAR